MPNYMKTTKKLLNETKNTSYSKACNSFIQAYEDELKSKPRSDQALLTCYGCGEDGHVKNRCPNKNGDSKVSSHKLFCRFCKKHGHEINNCRKLKAKKARQQQQQNNNRRNNNRRNNSRYQANVMGSVEPYVLLTVVEGFDDGSDPDDLPDLLPLDSDSDTDYDSDSSDDFSQTRVRSIYNDAFTPDVPVVDSNIDEVVVWDFESDSSEIDAEEFVFMAGTDQHANDGPFIDSACSVRMWNDKDDFIEYTPLRNRYVRVGDDQRLEVAGEGKVKVSSPKSILPLYSLMPFMFHHSPSV
mmetsp:Transcript_9048/g.11873  ORF Transcript_9048/g.11873 Transcript_9048/m.11873 type:complete len:298 (+) Transcript_9048:649-1542(+)